MELAVSQALVPMQPPVTCNTTVREGFTSNERLGRVCRNEITQSSMHMGTKGECIPSGKCNSAVGLERIEFYKCDQAQFLGWALGHS